MLALGVILGVAGTYLCGGLSSTERRPGLPAARGSLGDVKWGWEDAQAMSALLAKDDRRGAWRFGVNALRSSDSGVNNLGAAFLLRLAVRSAAYLVPVQALLEDRLIHGQDLSWGQCFGLLDFCFVSAWPPNPSAAWGPMPGGWLRASHEAADLASESFNDGVVSSRALQFCDRLLSQKDPRMRERATPILLVAARLGEKDRQWALRTAKGLMAHVPPNDKTGIWVIVYEAVSGQFVR